MVLGGIKHLRLPLEPPDQPPLGVCQGTQQIGIVPAFLGQLGVVQVIQPDRLLQPPAPEKLTPALDGP